MTSGIYLVAHPDSGKFYIGSSVDIQRRWGVKLTSEHCAAMSAANMGKPGRPVLAKTRAKISKSLMGHVVSQKVRDAVRAAHTGATASLETRSKMSAAQKERHAKNGGVSAAVRSKIAVKNRAHAAARSAKITHCPKGHEYTEENTYYGAHHSRNCRLCARDRKRVKDAEKKQVVSSQHQPLTITQED